MIPRGELSLVVPGCSIWDKRPDCDPDEAEHMRGGIVVSIERKVDADTGELVDLYRCADPYRGRVKWSSIPAEHIEQWTPPNYASIRYLIRHMAKMVATGKGALDTDDMRSLDTMALLARTL